MVHVAKDFFGVLDNRMAPLPFDVGDEADATGVVFVIGVVESRLGGAYRQRFGWHGGCGIARGFGAHGS